MKEFRTSDLVTASKRMKPEMILEGMHHLTLEFANMANQLKILNNWLIVMPSLVEANESAPVDLRGLNERFATFQKESDRLTEQIVVHAENISNLKKSSGSKS